MDIPKKIDFHRLYKVVSHPIPEHATWIATKAIPLHKDDVGVSLAHYLIADICAKYLALQWQGARVYPHVVSDFTQIDRYTLRDRLRQSRSVIRKMALQSERHLLYDYDVVHNVFGQLVSDGVIFREYAVRYWSLRYQTVIPDHALRNEEQERPCYHIRFFIDTKKHTMMAKTFHPHYIFATVALVVHPLDKRFKKFVGKHVIVPLINKTIPVIADEMVDMTQQYGGVVMLTPAHDRDHYEIARKHELPVDRFAVDNTDNLTERAGEFAGLPLKKYQENIIQYLQDISNLDRITEEKTMVSYYDDEEVGQRAWHQWLLDYTAWQDHIDTKLASDSSIDDVEYIWWQIDTPMPQYRCLSQQADQWRKLPVIGESEPKLISLDDIKEENSLVTSHKKLWYMMWRTWVCSQTETAWSFLHAREKLDDKEDYVSVIDEKYHHLLMHAHEHPDDWLSLCEQAWETLTLGGQAVSQDCFDSMFVDVVLVSHALQQWEMHQWYMSVISPQDGLRFLSVVLMTQYLSRYRLINNALVVGDYRFERRDYPHTIYHQWGIVGEMVDMYSSDAVRVHLSTTYDFQWTSVVEEKAFLQKIWNAGRFLMMQEKAWPVSEELSPLSQWIVAHCQYLREELAFFMKKMQYMQARDLMREWVYYGIAEHYISLIKKFPDQHDPHVTHYVRQVMQSVLFPFMPLTMRRLDTEIVAYDDLAMTRAKDYKYILLMNVLTTLHRLKDDMGYTRQQKPHVIIQSNKDFQVFLSHHEDLVRACLHFADIEYVNEVGDIPEDYVIRRQASVHVAMTKYVEIKRDINQEIQLLQQQKKHLEQLMTQKRQLLSSPWWSSQQRHDLIQELEDMKHQLTQISYQHIKMTAEG